MGFAIAQPILRTGGNALGPGRGRASARPLAASQGSLVRNEANRARVMGYALSRAALAPQLTDRAVCEPPQIPLAVLSQSREAPGQPGAQFIAIVVRKLGISSDKLPRLVERGIDEFSDSRVETCLRWHRLLPYTFGFLSHEKPCQSSTEAHAALPNIAAPPAILISNSNFECLKVRCSVGLA